jgi:prepilin-type N-terminal cleavage/methylation domain-containing protein
MSRLRPRPRDAQRGYTLIELMVVVLVIGIIASISIPAFLRYRESSQDAAARSLLRNAAIAMETFYSENEHVEISSLATGSAAEAETTMRGYEPNIGWDRDNFAALAKDNGLGFVYDRSPGATEADRYILQSVSASGDVHSYYRNENSQTFRCATPAPGGVHTPAWIPPAGAVPSLPVDCVADEW